MKNNLTAIIISFYRPEYLEECLDSIKRQYPYINIIVGNNGPADDYKEELCTYHNAKYIKLPYDCGVCVGRNMLVDEVKTPYVLVGDDDFYYEKESKVDLLLYIIENSDLDLVGGRIRENNNIRDYQGFIHERGDHLKYEKLEIDGNNTRMYQRCDLTFNYFVAKVEAVKDTKWDEKIKVAYEHSTFFIDFKRKGYKVGFNCDAIVTHKSPIVIKNREEHKQYAVYRNRKNDKKRFFEKFGIDYTITMSGYKDVFDVAGTEKIDFLITTFERKECLKRLLFSITEFYPKAHITIADQSKVFDFDYYKELWKELLLAGLKNKPKAYNCGYDVGLSYCRNFLVGKTQREYKLILEDDFVFNRFTNISEMINKLEENPKYDIIGGAVLENGNELDFVHNFEIKGDTLYHREVSRTTNIGIECDCIPNFFLAKSTVFKNTLWDEQIKINGEHTDFFLRLYTIGIRILYYDYIKIEHIKASRDPKYKELRERKDGLVHFFNKNNLKRMVYKNKFCYELDGNKIKSYSNYNK